MKRILPIVVLMVALLAVGASAKMGGGSKDCPMMSGGQKTRMMNMLDLSAEQQEKIENIKLEFYKEQIELQAKLKIAKLELYEAMLKENSGYARLVREIADIKEQLLENKVKKDLKIRRVLTREQWVMYVRHHYKPKAQMMRQGAGHQGGMMMKKKSGK